MIPLILIVAGYVMFRYVEVLCKRSDGQFSKAGYAVMVALAIALLIATGLLTAYAYIIPARAKWQF